MTKGLTVKELKEILKDIPDDYGVTVISDDLPYHIMWVTSVSHLFDECEEYPNVLSFGVGYTDMDNETKFLVKKFDY